MFNKITLKRFNQFGNSLLKISKSTGPITKRWGRLQSTNRLSDNMIFFKVNVLMHPVHIHEQHKKNLKKKTYLYRRIHVTVTRYTLTVIRLFEGSD